MTAPSAQKQVFISICLDTRREKSNGKYPVKLRVFTPQPRIQKLYSTKFEFTPKEFSSIWETIKPRAEFKDFNLKLRELNDLANKIAENIIPFSFDQFEKKLNRNTGDGANILYQYECVIKRLNENNQLGTASNYSLSKKSLIEFVKHLKGQEPQQLFFTEITSAFLEKYENYMINTLNRSRTTVSMYLRAARTLFNIAISEQEIDSEIYPFGKRKYQIPSVRNVKKALSKDQLKTLFDAKPQTTEQQKAKDFWFFSYICNGMNIKDIAMLRYENIHDGEIVFYRAKTINTSKTDSRPVSVSLTKYAKLIIKKYGNKPHVPKNYIFPIIEDSMDEVVKRAKIQNFTRFINQNIKTLALAEGITSEISTYWARHSFATNAIRNGASMEFVSEALNHSNMKTTQGYFAGFEEKSKKELMDKMMNF